MNTHGCVLSFTLSGLALAIALPAYAQTSPSSGSYKYQEEFEQIVAYEADYRVARVNALLSLREWLGLPEIGIPEDDLEHLVGSVSTSGVTVINYSDGQWEDLGVAELDAGVDLGRAYVAFDLGDAISAGLYSIHVQGTGDGYYYAELINEVTQEVTHVVPATVTTTEPPTLAIYKKWKVVTLRQMGIKWVYDYHWVVGNAIIGVELGIPEPWLRDMADVSLDPAEEIVSVTRDFRDQVGAALFSVAGQEQYDVLSDFVYASRGEGMTIHTIFADTPTLSSEDLEAGAHIAFGLGKGTSLDPQYIERGNSLVPGFVGVDTSLQAFYLLSVSDSAATWADLDGGVLGQTSATIEVSEPEGTEPWIGAGIGVLDNTLACGWELPEAKISIEVNLPN